MPGCPSCARSRTLSHICVGITIRVPRNTNFPIETIHPLLANTVCTRYDATVDGQDIA